MKYEEMGRARRELYHAMIQAGATKSQAESNAVDYVLSICAAQNCNEGVSPISVFAGLREDYTRAIERSRSEAAAYERKKYELEKARRYYEQEIEAQKKALEDEKNEFEVEKEEFFDNLSLLETAECRDRLRLALIYKQTVERPTDPYARAFYNQGIGAILAGGPLPNIKKNKE